MDTRRTDTEAAAMRLTLPTITRGKTITTSAGITRASIMLRLDGLAAVVAMHLAVAVTVSVATLPAIVEATHQQLRRLLAISNLVLHTRALWMRLG
jgi:hypothetical protein